MNNARRLSQTLNSILPLLGLLVTAGTASADIVYTNFTPAAGTGFDSSVYYQVSNSGLIGQYFTNTTVVVPFTMPLWSDYRLDKIEVVAKQAAGYACRLHAYIVPNPAYIGLDYNATNLLPTTPGMVVFDTTTYTKFVMKASKTYYLKIQVDNGNGSCTANWYKNSAGVTGTVLYNNPSAGSTTWQPLGTNIQYPVFRISGTPQAVTWCNQPATSYDGSPVTANWDGANCYIKDVVAGATPFIWNNSYYVAAEKSSVCLAGSWDSANCFYMIKPAGGFLVNDKFYVTPGPGNSCSAGSYDGTGCLIKGADWTTHAFEYLLSNGQTGWYFTSQFTCKDGGYDGANCYIMKPPPGATAFIYNNAFYYAP
jgi:hypothetical protein